MINFYDEVGAENLFNESWKNWIKRCILAEEKKNGEISIILVDDEYLLNLNKKFLDHDTFTDIITFDNSMGETLAGELYISIPRVRENAEIFGVDITQELRRVVIHGILHLCGYKDKTIEEERVMREKENEKLEMFHVEQ